MGAVHCVSGGIGTKGTVGWRGLGGRRGGEEGGGLRRGGGEESGALNLALVSLALLSI